MTLACRAARDDAVARFGLRTTPTERPSLARAREALRAVVRGLPRRQAATRTRSARARSIRRPPASATRERLDALSPYRVYNALTFGVPGTAMASFDVALRRRPLEPRLLRVPPRPRGRPRDAGRSRCRWPTWRRAPTASWRTRCAARGTSRSPAAASRARGARPPSTSRRPASASTAHAAHAAAGGARRARGPTRGRRPPGRSTRTCRASSRSSRACARRDAAATLAVERGFRDLRAAIAAARRAARAGRGGRARRAPRRSSAAAAPRVPFARRVPHLLPRGRRGRAAGGRAARGRAPAGPARRRPLRPRGLAGRAAGRRRSPGGSSSAWSLGAEPARAGGGAWSPCSRRRCCSRSASG